MDTQEKNQIKQHQERLKKQQEYNDRLAPVRVQDAYNKENLETQHKYNLEIFEKQAALTREIQKKQNNLTIILIIITALATIFASIIGALLNNQLSQKQQHEKTQTIQGEKGKISIETNQPQYANPAAEAHPKAKTELSEQGVSSSRNVSSKKSP